MKRRKIKLRGSKYQEYSLLVGVFILMISIFYLGSQGIGKKTQLQEQTILEDAIRRAVVQCYAIEGMYPPDIDYIKTHYGVGIDEKKYIVHYEVFASNIMPTIKVIKKSWEE